VRSSAASCMNVTSVFYDAAVLVLVAFDGFRASHVPGQLFAPPTLTDEFFV
jgi:hypothetical protein